MSNFNRPSKSGAKRTNSQYSLSGALVTVLLVLLYWWFSGGAPTGEMPSDASGNPANAATATIPETATKAAAAANVGITQSATVTTTAVLAAPATKMAVTPTARAVPPTATIEPVATATLLPLSTATKPPKPTPFPTHTPRAGPPGIPDLALDELPPEALETLDLIEQGGPFPFDRDGISFQNRERLLPQKPRDYYREYTVITPGESDRGARRIVAGENGELYYSDDHYNSFFWIVTE